MTWEKIPDILDVLGLDLLDFLAYPQSFTLWNFSTVSGQFVHLFRPRRFL